LEAVLDGGGLPVPGEAQDAPAEALQGRVFAAIGCEGGFGVVGVPAVELDDEPVLRPTEVDLEAWVVGDGKDVVDQPLGEIDGADEVQEPGLEVAAGPLARARTSSMARWW
jgi:hypothetical protein